MMAETQPKPSEILQRVWDEHGATRFDFGYYWDGERNCGCAIGNLAHELGAPPDSALLYDCIIDHLPDGLYRDEIEVLDSIYEREARLAEREYYTEHPCPGSDTPEYEEWDAGGKQYAVQRAVGAAIAYLEGIDR